MAGANSFLNAIATRPYFIAIILTVFLVAWMASGNPAQSAQPDVSSTDNADVEEMVTTVRVKQFSPQPVTKTLTLYGRTEPNRNARIGAEVSGQVVQVFAKRGAMVQQGDPIVRLEMNDRQSQLDKANAMLRQRQIEYDGVKKLNQKGFQGRARLAEAEASLIDAKANVAALTLQIDKTLIKAPLTGILNERMVEVGDYLAIGDPVAQISDIDPLIVVGDVTEKNITGLSLGQKAHVELIDGSALAGSIRYISSVSSPATNTFRIEVAIENPDNSLLAGLSAELEVPLEETAGIKVTPAVLALDDDGNLGIKSVEQDRVVFSPIKVIKAEEDGVWLAGFEQEVTVITVGQGFVNPGDKVSAVTAQDAAATETQL
ncbi:efflux RND transporter periplasmic adaptor subunit [Motilimonas pumila]|uniref:Efflux RND transporter periplasmic adaptor subunit n=1 Tax=Motilimonas pumila TaxID=2303987 RepID=A0A418YC32_9GAMM|nr:efflux RND transporter periplasmic adaptor subunit [Motilimonas pumila]RJG42087.1 efflux RND transporter periplasmic adaptor subunit [Motilimonas pumila]